MILDCITILLLLLLAFGSEWCTRSPFSPSDQREFYFIVYKNIKANFQIKLTRPFINTNYRPHIISTLRKLELLTKPRVILNYNLRRSYKSIQENHLLTNNLILMILIESKRFSLVQEEKSEVIC